MHGITSPRRPSAPARAQTPSALGSSHNETAPLQRSQQPDRQDTGHASPTATLAIAHQSMKGCDLAGGNLIWDEAAATTAASNPLAAELDVVATQLICRRCEASWPRRVRLGAPTSGWTAEKVRTALPFDVIGVAGSPLSLWTSAAEPSP